MKIITTTTLFETTQGYYFFELGKDHQENPPIPIWVSRQVIKQYGQPGQNTITLNFPLKDVGIHFTSKKSCILIPKKHSNVFYVQAFGGYLNGDVQIISHSRLISLLDKEGRDSKDSMRKVKYRLAETQEDSLVLSWKLTGLTYGKAGTGTVKINMDGTIEDTIVDNELEKLL